MPLLLLLPVFRLCQSIDYCMTLEHTSEKRSDNAIKMPSIVKCRKSSRLAFNLFATIHRFSVCRYLQRSLRYTITKNLQSYLLTEFTHKTRTHLDVLDVYISWQKKKKKGKYFLFLLLLLVKLKQKAPSPQTKTKQGDRKEKKKGKTLCGRCASSMALMIYLRG